MTEPRPLGRRRRLTLWGGTILAAVALAISHPLGIPAGAGVLVATAAGPSYLGFVFGQVAVGALLAVGTPAFVLAEVGLLLGLAATLPTPTDRAGRYGVAIGCLSTVLLGGGVAVLLWAELDPLVVACGVGMAGTILLYRLQRYGRLRPQAEGPNE